MNNAQNTIARATGTIGRHCHFSRVYRAGAKDETFNYYLYGRRGLSSGRDLHSERAGPLLQFIRATKRADHTKRARPEFRDRTRKYGREWLDRRQPGNDRSGIERRRAVDNGRWFRPSRPRLGICDRYRFKGTVGPFPALKNAGIIGREALHRNTAQPFISWLSLCYTGAVSEPSSDKILDLRGLRCPHPVLRAKKALRDVPVGGVLVLECTDPLTVIDVPHFVNQTGHLLAEHRKQDNLYIFRIVKQR